MIKLLKDEAYVAPILNLAKAYYEEADGLYSQLELDLNCLDFNLWTLMKGMDSFVFTLGAINDETGELEGVYIGRVASPIYSTGKVGMDVGLFVDKAARCKGIGQQLVMAAEAEFEKRGCKLVTNGTNSGKELSKAANKMYENLGYVEVGRTFQRLL